MFRMNTRHYCWFSEVLSTSPRKSSPVKDGRCFHMTPKCILIPLYHNMKVESTLLPIDREWFRNVRVKLFVFNDFCVWNRISTILYVYKKYDSNLFAGYPSAYGACMICLIRCCCIRCDCTAAIPTFADDNLLPIFFQFWTFIRSGFL